MVRVRVRVRDVHGCLLRVGSSLPTNIYFLVTFDFSIKQLFVSFHLTFPFLFFSWGPSTETFSWPAAADIAAATSIQQAAVTDPEIWILVEVLNGLTLMVRACIG